MDWSLFITYIYEKAGAPILHSLLTSTKLLKETDDTITISCSNLGAKIYLENKKEELREHLMSYLDREVSLEIEISEVVKKKPKKVATQDTEEMPLIKYPESFDGLLAKASLQKRFSLENFAVSNSNQIAFAAAKAVAENPGNAYNPLFLYGGVGVGKTHLLQAIGQEILKKDGSKKIIYCTSEEFTNDLIEQIHKRSTQTFRSKYRFVDVLLVDDAQFIAGKSYIQEEFYHTFNTIVKNGGQILLCSDRHPKEIKELEDRLRSRFSGGLIIDIQSPDFELRTAILLIKAKERNISIDMDAAKKLAETMTDARELEGMLLQIYSKSLLLSTEGVITRDIIDTEVEKRQEEFSKKATPHDIIKAACVYYDIKPTDIKGTSRKAETVKARQIVMYILRHSMKYKLEEIAYFLKKKDHTTIIHGVDKIQNMIMRDATFKKEVDRITSSV
ncbi:MAG: chromosomal replication initiator protein DnaA [Candidatus Roizmanbacteria bacterium]